LATNHSQDDGGRIATPEPVASAEQIPNAETMQMSKPNPTGKFLALCMNWTTLAYSSFLGYLLYTYGFVASGFTIFLTTLIFGILWYYFDRPIDNLWLRGLGLGSRFLVSFCAWAGFLIALAIKWVYLPYKLVGPALLFMIAAYLPISDKWRTYAASFIVAITGLMLIGTQSVIAFCFASIQLFILLLLALFQLYIVPKGERLIHLGFGFVLTVGIAAFFSGPPPDQTFKLVNNPLIQYVYRYYGGSSELIKHIGYNSNIALEDCHQRVLITGKEKDRNQFAAITYNHPEFFANGSFGDQIILDCVADEFFINHMDIPAISIFNDNNLTLKMKYTDLPIRNIKRLRYDPVQRMIYASSYRDDFILQVDLNGKAVKGGMVGGRVADFLILPKLNMCIVSKIGGTWIRYDLSRFKEQTRIQTHDLISKIESDVDQNYFWALNLFTGKLTKIEAATFKKQIEVSCGMGTRYFAIDPKGKYLAVTNAASGEVILYDRDGLKEKNRYYVGPRPQNIWFEPDGKWLLVAGSLGVYRIILQ